MVRLVCAACSGPALSAEQCHGNYLRFIAAGVHSKKYNVRYIHTPKLLICPVLSFSISAFLLLFLVNITVSSLSAAAVYKYVLLLSWLSRAWGDKSWETYINRNFCLPANISGFTSVGQSSVHLQGFQGAL